MFQMQHLKDDDATFSIKGAKRRKTIYISWRKFEEEKGECREKKCIKMKRTKSKAHILWCFG